MNQMSQADYELREAKSEIRRHHELITDLRDGLAWTLVMLDEVGLGTFNEEDDERISYLKRLLNRQVS